MRWIGATSSKTKVQIRQVRDLTTVDAKVAEGMQSGGGDILGSALYLLCALCALYG